MNAVLKEKCADLKKLNRVTMKLENGIKYAIIAIYIKVE